MRRPLLAMLLFLSLTSVAGPLWADGASLEEATDVQKQSAQIRYLEGMRAFQRSDFETARKNFNDSFETVASPNSLLMVVRSLVALKRNVEAYEQANKTARLADKAAETAAKYSQTAAAARREAETLRERLGFVSLLGVEGAAAGAKLLVAGRDIPREQWGAPIPVEAGTVSLSIDGRVLPTTEVAAGSTETVDVRKVIAADKAPDGKELGGGDGAAPPRVGSYSGPDRLMMTAIAGGIGAAGFITAAAFGGLAQGKFNDLEEACPLRACPTAELEDEADTGRSYQTASNTGLVFGIVGTLAVGVLLTWHLVEPAAPDQPDSDAADDVLARLHPTLHFGPTSIALQGSF